MEVVANKCYIKCFGFCLESNYDNIVKADSYLMCKTQYGRTLMNKIDNLEICEFNSFKSKCLLKEFNRFEYKLIKSCDTVYIVLSRSFRCYNEYDFMQFIKYVLNMNKAVYVSYLELNPKKVSTIDNLLLYMRLVDTMMEGDKNG